MEQYVAKLSVGSDVKVQVSSTSSRKISQVSEPVSMHDNFVKNIDIKPKEQGTGSSFYSPLVLSIAQKEGVSFDELQSIQGTGQEGRVSKKDVLGYIEKRKTGQVQVQSNKAGQAQTKKK